MVIENLTENLKERADFANKHINIKLIRRLKIFALMFVTMLGFLVYDIVQHGMNPMFITGGFILGIIVGALAGRIFNIHWNKESEKVVATLDTEGIVILVLYITFSIFRQNIFGTFVRRPVLAAFTFSFAAGAILGRLITMNAKIRNVLNNQGITRD